MLDRHLYHYRKFAVIAAFLFIFYIIFSFWFYVPHTDFDFYWRPDDQQVIEDVPEESLAAPFLQGDDIVLAIDGKTVHRSAVLYISPIKASYEYTIQRGDQILEFDIPFTGNSTSIGLSYRVPSVVLTLVFLITGTIIIRFARKDNIVAIRVAYTFLVSSVAVIGLQGELISVTGAWVARLIWFFAIVGTFYLGFVPHLKPLSSRVNTIFNWQLIAACILGIAAFLEAAILFPMSTSLDRLVGIGFYEFVLLISGISWLVVFATLAIRAYQMPSQYEKQQIRILLYFIALAILPVALLTLIPRAILDVTFLPFPIAIALFVLVPAGFFFIIYRRGYLGLDVVFSKTTVFLTIALITLTIYGTGLHFVNRQFDFGSDPVLPATLMLLPIIMFVTYTNQPINDWVSKLFYGTVTTNQSLPEFWSALSSEPELTTLKAIVDSLVKDFQIPRALLVLTNTDSILSPVAQFNVEQWHPEPIENLSTFHKPLLRSDERVKPDHPLFHAYNWLELLIPIIVRDKQIGFLAMSRPKDGYFNAEQVVFLSRVADMIAIGSEAIFLFEAAGRWSLQLLTEREMQRKYLASLIHDQPLQTITLATDKLQQISANPRVIEPKAAEELREQVCHLKGAMEELRQICVGLFPPVIEQGLDLVVEEVTEQFKEKFGLSIEQQVDVPDELGTTDLSTAIYQVLTEALNNVVKHAQTQNVEVSLICHDSHLILEVADDGVGSSLPSLSLSELARQQHVGVRSMSEFAKLVHGNLAIHNNKPHGTKVILEIPLN